MRFGSQMEKTRLATKVKEDKIEEKKKKNEVGEVRGVSSIKREDVPISFKKFPKNFKVLFAFPQLRGNCHGMRLTAEEIFSHEGMLILTCLVQKCADYREEPYNWEDEVTEGHSLSQAPREARATSCGQSVAIHQVCR